MKRSILTVAIAAGAFMGEASGTNRYYNDIVSESPSQRYMVTAKSPENSKKKGREAFQAHFVYECRDTTAGKLLWTRKQPMGKSEPIVKGSSYKRAFPKEGSPSLIFVSDIGWTVIITGWDELIAVDPGGTDRCHIRLLHDAITGGEYNKYVHETTAGPIWQGFSLWYFLETGGQHLFVIRPWWGRRIIVNMETGELLRETAALSESTLSYERARVLKELAEGVETQEAWEKEGVDHAVGPPRTAAWLAGQMQLAEAIPFLEKLQDSAYSGSSTFGGPGMGERFEGEVNPHSYRTFTLRQVTHLSLRRLGRTPKPLPANEFDVKYKQYKKHRPYVPAPGAGPRHDNADKVQKGMKAEQVLDLLGGPDFSRGGTWEYDMDANPPFSLVIKWDVRHVTDIQKQTPALWKDGFARDQLIISGRRAPR